MSLPSTPSPAFQCDRCSKCCRVHRVPLTREDVQRLSEGGQKLEDFTEFLSPEEVDMGEEPESFAWLKQGRRVLVLRHAESNLGCVFLNEQGCGVHPFRPAACRSYPYDRPDEGPGLGLVPGALCPSETGVLITLGKKPPDPTVQEFVSAVQKRDEETKQHAEFIARFNLRQSTRVRLGRTPQTGAEFLAELLRDELPSQVTRRRASSTDPM